MVISVTHNDMTLAEVLDAAAGGVHFVPTELFDGLGLFIEN